MEFSRNLRLVFRFEEGDACDADVVDYSQSQA